MNGTVFVGGGLTTGSLRDAARLYSLLPGVDSTWTVMDTPTYWYALIEHDSQLLLVGGCDYLSQEVTNKIFTLKDGEFVETLPPMREKRHSPSVVSSESVLVVAGGGHGGTSEWLSSVEVFKDGRWMKARSSLPTAGSWMKSALHGDQWYLFQQNGNVLKTCIHSLLSEEGQSPWEILTDAPNVYSASAYFSDHLLSIGGGDGLTPTSAIHAFSSTSKSWEHVADLPLPLNAMTTAVSQAGKLIVVGGEDKKGKKMGEVFLVFLKGLFVCSTIPQCFLAM